MADGDDEDYLTSDEHLDPHCEPCFHSKKRSIHVYGYCHECYQFMCPDCHVHHGQFPLIKNHVILRGSKMPKSIADKPPKYERCDEHSRHLKDIFCCDHNELICLTCSETDHNVCLIKSVEDICKTIPSSYLDDLSDTGTNLKEKANCIKVAVETNAGDLAEQRNYLVREIQKVNTKVNVMCQNIQPRIAAEYDFQKERLNGNKKKMNDILTRTEKAIDETKKLKGRPIDVKLFLKIQENVQYMKHIEDEINAQNQSRRFLSLKLDNCILLTDIMSDSATFGFIITEESKVEDIDRKGVVSAQLTAASQITGLNVTVKSTQYQSQSFESRNPGERSQLTLPVPVPISQIKVTKQNSHYAMIRADDLHCFISGVAITKGNNILLVDACNSKVKLFTPDMTCFSCVSLSDRPRDIHVAVISDKQAIVTTDNKKLVILNIKEGKIADLLPVKHLSVKQTVQLQYDICGVASYKDKLVITCPFTDPPSVKLIDLTGRLCWLVSTDHQGQRLFIKPWYVCCHDYDGTSTVVVTDIMQNTLTLLEAETGVMVATRQLMGNKGPYGVTTDTVGNVYVCYYGTDEVSVLSRDLTQERILLTRRDGLSRRPKATVYHKTRKQIIVSYDFKGSIDCFQIF